MRTYQFPSLLRDGTDIHGVAFNHIQEPYLGDCNGADHVNPPERLGQGYKCTAGGSRLSPRSQPGQVVEGWGGEVYKHSGHCSLHVGYPVSLSPTFMEAEQGGKRVTITQGKAEHTPVLRGRLQCSPPEVAQTAFLRDRLTW